MVEQEKLDETSATWEDEESANEPDREPVATNNVQIKTNNASDKSALHLSKILDSTKGFLSSL